MSEKLTFEDWLCHYVNVETAPGVKESLSRLYDIDSCQEIENILRQEYQCYLVEVER